MDRAQQAPAVTMETTHRDKPRSRKSGQVVKQRHVDILFILALALLCTATAGLADSVPVPLELINYINQPAHVEAVEGVIRGEAAQIPMCHPTRNLGRQLTAPGPVLFGANGQPSGGRWTEHLKVDGCSQSGIFSGVFNVMTFVDKSGEIHTVGLLPGTTKADPLLQKDALAYVARAFIAASGHNPVPPPAGCKLETSHIIDTAFDGFSGAPAVDVPPGRDPRPWRENWTLLACNVPFMLSLQFTPDANGVTFALVGASARLK